MASDDPTDGFGPALQGAATHWRESFRTELVARGLAAAAGAGGEVLVHLTPSGLTQTVLTQRMGLSKQAVQQLLDQLETSGLVRRETDPADKRMKHVVLTDAGQAALAARRSVTDELEAQLRDRFGKKLYKKLRKALREVAAP